jgi:methane monooxygenase component A gamma chain
MSRERVPATNGGASRAPAKEGADFRLDESPYGDKAKRDGWVARIDALGSLSDAVPVLLEWRETRRDEVLTDQDDLWIEARLEEKVAVLRFDEMTNDQIRSETLTDEKVAEVCERYLETADEAVAADDSENLEEIVAEFRKRYQPPIMPSSPYMRAETELAERLMKTRDTDWYGESVEELREARGVIVHKKGNKA